MIEWSENGKIATFSLQKVGDLRVWQIFSSSTDGSRLKITGLNRVTGEVDFRVSHVYEDDDCYRIRITVTDDDRSKETETREALVFSRMPDANGSPGLFSFKGDFQLQGLSNLIRDARLFMGYEIGEGVHDSDDLIANPLPEMTMTPLLAGLASPGDLVEVSLRGESGEELGAASTAVGTAGNWVITIPIETGVEFNCEQDFTIEVIQKPAGWAEAGGLPEDVLSKVYSGSMVIPPTVKKLLTPGQIIGDLFQPAVALNSTDRQTGVGARDVENVHGDEQGSHSEGDGSVVVINASFSGEGIPVGGNRGGIVEGATLIDGQFGTLTIMPDGTYSYVVNEAATEYLGAEDSVFDEFTYQVANDPAFGISGASDTAVLTITVQGSEDIPVADHEAAGEVEIGEVAQTNPVIESGPGVADMEKDIPVAGSVVRVTNVTFEGTPFPGSTNEGGPVDATGTTAVDGAYGTLVIAPAGTYVYTLKKDQAVSLDELDNPREVFTYTVVDGPTEVDRITGLNLDNRGDHLFEVTVENSNGVSFHYNSNHFVGFDSVALDGDPGGMALQFDTLITSALVFDYETTGDDSCIPEISEDGIDWVSASRTSRILPTGKPGRAASGKSVGSNGIRGAAVNVVGTGLTEFRFIRFGGGVAPLFVGGIHAREEPATLVIAVDERNDDGGVEIASAEVVEPATQSVDTENDASDLHVITNGPIDRNGIVTVSGTITDPGVLGTHEVVIDFADPNNTDPATFDLSGKHTDVTDHKCSVSPGLGVGDTISSSTDHSFLTITGISDGVITFMAEHQYLDDGVLHPVHPV